MPTSPTIPQWLLPAALAVLAAVIVILVVEQPFGSGDGNGGPEAGADAANTGDADRGATLFARSCASCHGDNGEGANPGPPLVLAPRLAENVVRVIARGRGVMPAGIVTGQDADDVAAHVAHLSVDATGSSEESTQNPGDSAGRLELTGQRLSGVFVELAEPAPTRWTVWLEGQEGLARVGQIAAGQTVLADPDLGRGPLLGSFDAVLLGESATEPTLRGGVTATQSAGIIRLILGDAAPPAGESLVSIAGQQMGLFGEFTRFLVAAREGGRLPQLRVHGERLVNIAYGAPAEELDGDGTAKNPGDGVGLLGQDDRPGHLPEIMDLAGDASAEPLNALQAAIRASAEDARTCANADQISDAGDCVDAIESRSAQIDTLWGAAREAALRSAVVSLERQ